MQEVAPPAGDFPIVDAHQHFWDLGRVHYPWLSEEPPPKFRYGDTRALRRNYLPPDYARDGAGLGIVKTVHIEAESDPADPVAESRWLQEIGARHGMPSALVAQVRLDRDDAEAVLAAQAACAELRGVRYKPKAALRMDWVEKGTPGSMGDPRWRRGYARLARYGLSFDLQTPWWHLYEAAELAAAYPETPIVLNHTGMPSDRSRTGLAGWRAAMRALAAAPNAAVKISGLGQPGKRWTAEGNRGVVRDTIEIFGAERCMFASNWPVDSLAADSLATIFRGFQDIVRDLPMSDRRRLFHDNAVRIYRLA